MVDYPVELVIRLRGGGWWSYESRYERGTESRGDRLSKNVQVEEFLTVVV